MVTSWTWWQVVWKTFVCLGRLGWTFLRDGQKTPIVTESALKVSSLLIAKSLRPSHFVPTWAWQGKVYPKRAPSYD